MKRAILGLLACGAAFGQRPDPAVTFDVASVKVSPPGNFTRTPPRQGCTGGPGTEDPGQYTCSRANINTLVTEAFGLKYYQLKQADTGGRRGTFFAGGPLPDGFDIVAKVPAGASREQFRTMLRNLLIERFKLAYHFEKKEGQVYDLVVARNGSKLKEAAPAPPGEDKPMPVPAGFPVPPRGNTTTMAYGSVLRMAAHDVPIDQLITSLTNLLSTTVTDATGLKGKYDFTLEYTGNTMDPPSDDNASAPSLFTAVQQQLGLKLEPKKGAVEMFVIDHVEKMPREN